MWTVNCVEQRLSCEGAGAQQAASNHQLSTSTLLFLYRSSWWIVGGYDGGDGGDGDGYDGDQLSTSTLPSSSDHHD